MNLDAIHSSSTLQIDPIVFQAEWPDRLKPEVESCIVKTAKIFWDVISYIIFPIILLRYLYDYLKDLALFFLVPGCLHLPETRIALEGMTLVSDCQGEKVKLSTPDGALLDAVFVKGAEHPKKVIILGFGNGMQWEINGPKLVELLQTFGTSILTLNPRGVGESLGIRSCEGYALDFYTGYEYLHHQLGIDLEDILLITHSMSGATGSLGAALVQEKYPDKKISIIHDRSFNNVSSAAEAVVGNFCCCLGPLARCLLFSFGIEMNSMEAFEKLKGKRCVIYNKGDEIIPYQEASLHYHLRQEIRDSITEIEMAPYWEQPHMRPYIGIEDDVFKDTVNEFLKLSE